jgi:hypothetical protein
MLNSSDVQRRIERSRLLAVLGRAARGDARRAIRLVYLHVLSRPPTDAEVAAAQAHVRSGGVSPKQAAEDLVWALINSKEFLYRH